MRKAELRVKFDDAPHSTFVKGACSMIWTRPIEHTSASTVLAVWRGRPARSGRSAMGQRAQEPG